MGVPRRHSFPRKHGPSPFPNLWPPTLDLLETAWNRENQAGILKLLGWKLLLITKINALFLLGLQPPDPRHGKKSGGRDLEKLCCLLHPYPVAGIPTPTVGPGTYGSFELMEIIKRSPFWECL